MGNGVFRDGGWDLTVSFPAIDTDHAARWKRCFVAASRLLYHATGGQMCFRRIFWAENFVASRAADIIVSPEAGASASIRGTVGSPGFHSKLRGETIDEPHVVVHEFGHYALGLGQEECVTGDKCPCIMRYGWKYGDRFDEDGNFIEGTIREFCTPENHDSDAGVEQDGAQNKDNDRQSCAETIAKTYGLKIPDYAATASLPPPEDPEFLSIDPRGRFVLVNHLADTPEERVGRVAFANASAFWQRFAEEVDHDVITIADAPIAEGTADVLGTALEAFPDAPRPSTQAIVLLSQDTGEMSESVRSTVASAHDRGVRIETLSHGKIGRYGLLHAIARGGRGRFQAVNPKYTAETRQLDLQTRLMMLPGHLVDGVGISNFADGKITTGATTVVGMEGAYDKSSLANVTEAKKRPDVVDLEFYVEENASWLTCVLTQVGSRAARFYLFGPDEKGHPREIVELASDPQIAFQDAPGEPFGACTIREPEVGRWRMRIVGAIPNSVTPFAAFALVCNMHAWIACKGLNYVGQPGGSVKLQFQKFDRTQSFAVQQAEVAGIQNSIRYLKSGSGPGTTSKWEVAKSWVPQTQLNSMFDFDSPEIDYDWVGLRNFEHHLNLMDFGHKPPKTVMTRRDPFQLYVEVAAEAAPKDAAKVAQEQTQEREAEGRAEG